MDKKKQIRNSTAEFLIFTTEGGEESIEVRYEDGTIWLSQRMMAVLFVGSEFSYPEFPDNCK
jgi:hypothetical protein